MATVKVKFRASSIATKEGALYYQVIHNRVARQIHTEYKIYPEEWNARNSEIELCVNENENRRNYLASLKEIVNEDIMRLGKIVDNLNRSGKEYSAEKIVSLFRSPIDECGFVAFSKRLIAQLKQIGKKRTAETYTTTLNSFVRFRKEKDIPLEEVDSNLMVEYESYLKAAGICPNTTSFYMRNLRAIYNRAVEKELTLQRYPFKYVYTGIDKTVKRAVPLKIIRQIKNFNLTSTPSVDYARDMFMFSFYTRGMSFVDMAFLKKTDIKNGILSYRRQKTNQQLFIKWEKPMQEIVEKYDTVGTPYLLPIIRNMKTDEWRQYKNAAHFVNIKLKKLGEQMGLTIPLTSYVARHAWASIAHKKNISISVISEAMGHDSENTTRIYLASLDPSVVDNANRLILKSL
ncbi:MAG TPA: site-specific integrase [Candidatus Barnesiella excrementigallinarum]|nr:site-specific integrase [Candidatus Barnesiella excrementigallinarum]